MIKFKKPPETTFTKYMKIGAIIVALIVIILEVRSCRQQPGTITPETEEQQKREILTPEETFARERAFYASKKYVQEVLQEADSLTFPSYGEEVKVIHSNNKIYLVKTWVDEMDSTGVNIRHTYEAEVERIEERNWKYHSLIMDGKKVK
ncbi:MAG: hypothetical protein LUG18_08855 [Candidatus Azobacteroides sp.]|nr:hypothetical protein [Candidatus Azobacteroides sp.]